MLVYSRPDFPTNVEKSLATVHTERRRNILSYEELCIAEAVYVGERRCLDSEYLPTRVR